MAGQDNITHREDGKVIPIAFEEPKKLPSRKWRRKYKCKKNKGDHTFVPVRQWSWIEWEGKMVGALYSYGICSSRRWFDGANTKILRSRVSFECSGCTKHHSEWNREPMEFVKPF